MLPAVPCRRNMMCLLRWSFAPSIPITLSSVLTLDRAPTIRRRPDTLFSFSFKFHWRPASDHKPFPSTPSGSITGIISSYDVPG